MPTTLFNGTTIPDFFEENPKYMGLIIAPLPKSADQDAYTQKDHCKTSHCIAQITVTCANCLFCPSNYKTFKTWRASAK